MLLQEGYFDASTLPSSGGLRRRSSAKHEDGPVDTSLHGVPSANKHVHQPYLRPLRTSNDGDGMYEIRAGRSSSDPGFLDSEEDEGDASPAAGVLGRFASLSASALNSSLPVLRGISSFTRSSTNDSTSTADIFSDTAEQQQHHPGSYDYQARQDAASTTSTILLARDCDATQAAARRSRCSSSSSATSPFSCTPRVALAGQAAADQGDGGLAAAAAAGYVDDAPAGSLGVPGARLLLATSAGKLTHRFKSDRDPKKSN